MLRLLLIVTVVLALAKPALAAESTKPNIIVIFVDDLGYADLGCQGSKEVHSPQIDSIAANGVRCTAGYVTAPMCSPSRAGLLTGRYQQRFGYEFNLGPEYTLKAGLDVAQTTIADRLRAGGYATGAIGKWDLGASPPYHPLQRGFDEFYGFLGGSRQHEPATRDMGPYNTMLRGRTPVKETDWSSDAYSKEAVAFVARHKGNPFFLYVCFTAPHWPMQAQAEDLALFADVPDLHRRTFLAMMSGLDRGVGRILDAVREHALEESTLIIFLSDNGGPTGPPRSAPDAPFAYGQNTSRNDPFRGVKGQLYEGGVRVPFLVQWKDRLPAGRVCDVPVSSLDIPATALAVAGIESDESLDGVDLIPLLLGNAGGERALFWRVGGQSAVRRGEWKLVSRPGKPAELYNLDADPGETTDLRDKQPDQLIDLREPLKGWNAGMERPRWSPRPSSRKKK